MDDSHAGGYQYRLAPLTDAPLTEADFQKMPLEFVGKQGLRWGGGPKFGGTELFFNATYVTEGTVPAGSAWVKNPIPLIGGDDGLPDPPGVPCFKPHCEEIAKCSHMGDAGQGTLEIVDYLRIPAGLKPGPYVLGWRWDCKYKLLARAAAFAPTCPPALDR